MLRAGSLLMILLVTVPMVRDCCVPVTHLLPCHESEHGRDVACFSNQQAIAETKGAVVSSSVDYPCPTVVDAKSAIVTHIRRAPERSTLVPTQTGISLRTGALLI